MSYSEFKWIIFLACHDWQDSFLTLFVVIKSSRSKEVPPLAFPNKSDLKSRFPSPEIRTRLIYFVNTKQRYVLIFWNLETNIFTDSLWFSIVTDQRIDADFEIRYASYESIRKWSISTDFFQVADWNTIKWVLEKLLVNAERTFEKKSDP